jgi:WS/DGAT/MGAT family acyltransferase
MAEEPGIDQRMGDADALMWSIEKDPMLRSTITSVLVLDRAIDHDRLADKVERASRAIPRLRQRVMANTFSIAPPRWEVDPNFDLRYHLRFLGAPGGGKMGDALAIAATEAMSSFDLARPLWQILVIDGMADGRSAVVVKLHHTITDGIGGVKLGMHLFDLEEAPADPGPLPEAPPVHVMSQFERVVDAWTHEQRQSLDLASRLIPAVAGTLAQLAWQPGETIRRAGDLAGSLARILAPATKPLSPIMTGRSLSVDLAVLSIPLADAKAAAKAAGGRINDFFMAGVLGGLRRYHDLHDVRPESLRMGMPISLRASGAGGAEGQGNQFVPTRFVVPLQIEDPAQRMRALRQLVAHQRAEPALAMVDSVSLLTRRLPKIAQIGVLGGLLRTVDVITSNVPGVPIPLYLAGAKMEAQYPFGPRSGAAVNVTLLSYLDGLFVGVNTDPAAVLDHDAFVGCLADGFDEVRKVA